MRFDGVDGRVDVASQSALEPSSISLTAWVRGSAIDPPVDGQVILEKGAFDCGGPSYGLSVAPGGIRLSIRSFEDTEITAIKTAASAKTTLWDGAWHLIGASIYYAGTYALAYMSIDGSPYGQQVIEYLWTGTHATAVQYSGTTSSALRIGGPVDASCATDFFHGDVDDVRVYDAYIDPATLLTPVATTLSVVGPGEGHPYGPATYTAHISPSPKWGWIEFRFVGPAVDMLLGYVYPDENGDAVLEGGIPIDWLGSNAIHVLYSGLAQYQSSSASDDVEVTAWPSTTTLTVSQAPPEALSSTTLTATVASAAITSHQYPQGTVEFYDSTGLSPVLLGTSSLVGFSPGISKATLSTSGLDTGARKLTATYVGPDDVRAGSTTGLVDVTVAKATSFVSVSYAGGWLEANNTFQLSASVGTGHNQFAADATITFSRVGSATPLCVVAVALDAETYCTVPAQPVGDWEYTAKYSGNAHTEGSTSEPLPLTIAANVVHATNVSTQYATFYPVKDSYLDTVAIRGTRGEQIGVTIRIYKPSGALLTTKTIATGNGAYAWAWNGRTSSGALLPEGKYKIVQTLKDAAGTSQSWTSYVNLSHKKLYIYTKTISKDGSAATAAGTQAGGTVSVNTSTDALKLYAPEPYYSWAGAGWQLTLPSATVYKSFYVRIIGRHSGASSLTRLGAQNFTWCALSSDWSEGCFGAWKAIPTTSGTTLYTYRTSNLSSAYRTGRTVRLSVSSYGGTTWIYKAQVVVTYGVLKY